MAVESYTTHDASAQTHRAFVVRRLHSLSGVVPLGLFLVEHLWTNARAIAGEGSFARGVADIQRIPFLPAVELFGIFLPLAFHALWGIAFMRTSRPNALRYSYAHNWLYVLQRVSGIVAFFFIVAHLWEYRVHKALFGLRSEAFYDTLSAHLSSTAGGVPLLALAYVVGLAAVVFHFANGLWGFACTWGLAVSRPAQRRVGIVASLLGVLLFGVGAMTIVSFATGSHFGMTEAPAMAGDVSSCPPKAP